METGKVGMNGITDVFGALCVALMWVVLIRMRLARIYRARGLVAAATTHEEAALIECGVAVYVALAYTALSLNYLGIAG